MIRKQNFASYEKESIPTNRIIKELEKIKTKRQKVVVDMGCGKADIAHYFKKKKDDRFLFYNYDHQSGGDEMIQEVDISELPLEDASVEITIMSLALWGTRENYIQYIREAYRVLESGGLIRVRLLNIKKLSKIEIFILFKIFYKMSLNIDNKRIYVLIQEKRSCRKILDEVNMCVWNSSSRQTHIFTSTIQMNKSQSCKF